MNAISSSLTRKPPARQVKLRFRSLATLTEHIPMVEVRDAETNEVLMVERLKETGGWLAAMGYSWCVGSNARWEQK